MATTFEKWMQRVDQAIDVIIGMHGIVTVDDLTDQPYMDWFEDETTPREAAAMVLHDNGWPVEGGG